MFDVCVGIDTGDHVRNISEHELAAWVPTWQMPQDIQHLALYLFGGSAVLCAGVGVWLAIKQRSAFPLACFVAAVLTVNLEPLIARMSSASHAQLGQLTAFVSEGRAIPVHVLLVYTAYFGFGYYFLVPALLGRKMSAKTLWTAYFVFTTIAWLFEAPFIRAGMWDYFGPQSWKPFGLMPVYFAFANVASSYIGCALLAAVLPMLSGVSRTWILLLGPAFTIGGHFAVTWPMYNLRTSGFDSWGTSLGAAVTITLCLLSTHLIVRIFTVNTTLP
jgi:hypothetical protein